jgi:hypothetical protein
MLFNPHEIVGRLVLAVMMGSAGVSMMPPPPDTQLTTQQIQQAGKQRSKEKAEESRERKQKLKKRKRYDNAKHSVGYCKRCGIYD